MKTVTVNICADDLSVLKQNKYSLCIACKDEDAGYDVVCRADTDYLSANTYAFYEDYQIFCCKNIQEAKPITLSVGPAEIAVGQQITIDSSGNFSSPSAGSSSDSFELINRFGSLYPGFCQKISSGGQEEFLPAFVAPYASVKGSYLLRPGNSILLWFEQFAQSGTFISGFLSPKEGIGKSDNIEVSLCDAGVTVCYQNGVWEK